MAIPLEAPLAFFHVVIIIDGVKECARRACCLSLLHTQDIWFTIMTNILDHLPF